MTWRLLVSCYRFFFFLNIVCFVPGISSWFVFFRGWYVPVWPSQEYKKHQQLKKLIKPSRCFSFHSSRYFFFQFFTITMNVWKIVLFFRSIVKLISRTLNWKTFRRHFSIRNRQDLEFLWVFEREESFQVKLLEDDGKNHWRFEL